MYISADQTEALMYCKKKKKKKNCNNALRCLFDRTSGHKWHERHVDRAEFIKCGNTPTPNSVNYVRSYAAYQPLFDSIFQPF